MLERGPALDERVKAVEHFSATGELDERLAWVSQLLENQRVSEDSGNLLHDLKSDLLPEEVLPLPPRAMSSTCPPALPASILPMRSIRRWATAWWAAR